ncbi:MAG: hypothetical protein HYX78_11685 [Armatimonadetes bacterium]|nr:hypothetical protein [Armatimonadota bacterium]
MDNNRFSHNNYLLRKQFLKLFGGSFRVYDPTGQIAVFANMKAFKLREDIGLYSDETKSTELLRIKARQIIDFSAAYDVFDSSSNDKIGSLKRRGLKSMLKDEWIIMDNWDKDIGVIQEDSWLLALVRRFVTNLVPQTYNGYIGTRPVFRFKQHFNPFVQKMDLDFSLDSGNELDRKLGIAAAVLLSAIEGRQR